MSERHAALGFVLPALMLASSAAHAVATPSSAIYVIRADGSGRHLVVAAPPTLAPAAAGSPTPSAIAPAGPLEAAGASLSVANSKLFSDPAGDVSCCTLDLMQIRVSNADAGTIIFDAAFNDQYGDPVKAAKGSIDIYVLLDTDRNPATGQLRDRYGFDYSIAGLYTDGSLTDLRLSHWATSTNSFRELRGSRIGGEVSDRHVRLSVDRHYLGDTIGFAFRFEAWAVALYNSYGDAAPDAGAWSFPVKIALSRLRPSLRISPTQPRPGRLLSASLALRVRGTKQLLASGRVLCIASIGARRLTGRPGAFSGRVARCSWRVPLRSKGKTVSGSVAVAVAPKALVSRRFAAPVR